MATLTEDFPTEILLRLSVMDVMRLKSVCKSWNSLIKSSSFISKYNNKSDNDNNDDDEPFIVIVNCDGTLILSSYNDLLKHHRSHQNQPQNPYTTYRNLNFRWVCCCDGGLMLGGVGYSEVRGIGFDSKNNEYKPFFARMVYLENMTTMEIDMFSSKMNQWRKLIVEQTEVTPLEYLDGELKGLSMPMGFRTG
ncbi:putative F-box protein At5g52610 [Ziziphus jujuba]|uniref:F-box protein At5g52610 n=1 Tax=Ziziphus jujuba TaxID=326968 RepID=A0ABM4A2X9_ZIZJJ|nr:putative F-box protein At5g52610 [Ziziphus jujuba]